MNTATNKNNNLTNGGILQKLLKVAIPIMAVQLVQMAYNLIDMFWLGRVGSNAIAASGAAGMFMWLSQGFLMIGRMGAEIGVSQSIGKGNINAARRYSSAAFQIALVLGLAFSLAAFFLRKPLIAFFGFAEQEVVELAEVYLAVVCASITFTFLSGVIIGCFNASGNSKTPFYMASAGIVVNILLDPLLIFTFNMGVAGAALATVISQIFVFLLLLWALKKSTGRPFDKISLLLKPKSEDVRDIFKWSLPVCIESISFTFFAMLTSRMEAAFGAHAMAVSRVGAQIESLSWLIGGGFASALTSFVGQNYGANKPKRVMAGMRISTFVMSGWGLLVSIIMFVFGGSLFMLFLPQAELLPLATAYLSILALCQIPMNLEGVAAGAFRGIGKTVPPSLASILCNIFRVVLAGILSAGPLGLKGVWWAISISAILRGAWIYIWFYVYSRKKKSGLVPESV